MLTASDNVFSSSYQKSQDLLLYASPLLAKFPGVRLPANENRKAPAWKQGDTVLPNNENTALANKRSTKTRKGSKKLTEFSQTPKKAT